MMTPQGRTMQKEEDLESKTGSDDQASKFIRALDDLASRLRGNYKTAYRFARLCMQKEDDVNIETFREAYLNNGATATERMIRGALEACKQLKNNGAFKRQEIVEKPKKITGQETVPIPKIHELNPFSHDNGQSQKAAQEMVLPPVAPFKEQSPKILPVPMEVEHTPHEHKDAEPITVPVNETRTEPSRKKTFKMIEKKKLTRAPDAVTRRVLQMQNPGPDHLLEKRIATKLEISYRKDFPDGHAPTFAARAIVAKLLEDYDNVESLDKKVATESYIQKGSIISMYTGNENKCSPKVYDALTNTLLEHMTGKKDPISKLKIESFRTAVMFDPASIYIPGQIVLFETVMGVVTEKIEGGNIKIAFSDGIELVYAEGIEKKKTKY
ncbi:MAG: hypothetical protein V1729_03090 [Candidatus Woesearchaeota archaeon]